MAIRIALAGNPNCGKTTLFNALTGANQYVGNWPGVTVEKKEGKLKGDKEVTITDLPGIYSLSPYTPEEVVARNYLIKERPDAIINIVDGTNIERNLYLSTQILELGIPVVLAVNMMDIVQKSGGRIDGEKLAEKMGCSVVEISALKGNGIDEAIKKAVAHAKEKKGMKPVHRFAAEAERAIGTVEVLLAGKVPENQERFFAIKLLEGDERIREMIRGDVDVSDEIKKLEERMDDDAESIIANERYTYISSIIGDCAVKGEQGGLTLSDKIDRIVTNRILALFGGAAWVATSAYFVGVAAIIVSGILLKKTKMFAGEPAPFVMELPAYHMPTASFVLHSMWERGRSFIKKAGTIILLSTIVLWFLMRFGWVDGSFGMLSVEQLDSSILAKIGGAAAWVFIPLGFGDWRMTVAAVTGLIAKENVVMTLGQLFLHLGEVSEEGEEVWSALSAALTPIAGYAFLVFNLLCAPCFAAMGAIRREMNNAKWFWYAIGYQCLFAYVIAMIVYRIGGLFFGVPFGFWTVVAFVLLAGLLYLLLRPNRVSKAMKVDGWKMAAAR